MKTGHLAGVLAIILCGAIGVVAVRSWLGQPEPRQVVTAQPERAVGKQAPDVVVEQRRPAPIAVVPDRARPEPRQAVAQANVKPKEPVKEAQNIAAEEPIVSNEVAREALQFVGASPEAEAIWVVAINDPNLTPHQRQDLIEDLNEDGFPDPKNITMDDLPLILSRIAIIEQLAPDAMDEVNEAAFAEAYKDLTNMVVRLATR